MTPSPANTTALRLPVAASAAAAIAIFLYRAAALHAGWQPLESHADGLLLITAVFALAVLAIQHYDPIPKLNLFALPVLTLLFAWAFCAATFTFRPFHIDSVWLTAHLAAVYLGSCFVALAGVAGALYLHARRKLNRRADLAQPPNLASLERIEALLIHAATVGFVTLTAGLALGLVITLNDPTPLANRQHFILKLTLAATVWLFYAVLINVRYASRFRGPRAAWLSIAGFALLLATFAIVAATPQTKSNPTKPNSNITQLDPAPFSAAPATTDRVENNWEVPPCASS